MVKAEWGEEKPLFVRISATDWHEKGWNIEDSIKLSKHLKELGVDLIDTSTGGNISGVKIPLKPGYQVEFAEKIKTNANIMTGAVGLIRTAELSEKILNTDKADFIFYGREALRNPYLPLRFANQLNQKENWPHQYKWAVME